MVGTMSGGQGRLPRTGVRDPALIVLDPDRLDLLPDPMGPRLRRFVIDSSCFVGPSTVRDPSDFPDVRVPTGVSFFGGDHPPSVGTCPGRGVPVPHPLPRSTLEPPRGVVRDSVYHGGVGGDRRITHHPHLLFYPHPFHPH